MIEGGKRSESAVDVMKEMRLGQCEVGPRRRCPLEPQRGKEMVFPLKPPENVNPANTLALVRLFFFLAASRLLFNNSTSIYSSTYLIQIQL